MKHPSLHFRDFLKEDSAGLESMVLALYEEDPPGQKMSKQKIRGTVRELTLHPEKGKITLICERKTVVGYAIVIYFWSNEYGGDIATIDELYVKPDWRGQGFGSAFIEHLAADKSGSLKGIALEVTPANARAYALYSRLGFVMKANRHLFRKL